MKNQMTPADQGIQASKMDAEVNGLSKDFAEYVEFSIKEGHHQNFANKFDFLEACLETYRDFNEDE